MDFDDCQSRICAEGQKYKKYVVSKNETRNASRTEQTTKTCMDFDECQSVKVEFVPKDKKNKKKHSFHV